MNKEQYKSQLDDLISSHSNAVSALKWKYVQENKKLNIGDIAKSRDGKILIKIDTIQYSEDYHSEIPITVYSGFILTKKMEPRKDKQRFSVFED